MTGDYAKFLAQKRRSVPARGHPVTGSDVNGLLHLWQRRIVVWAVRNGRAAIWEVARAALDGTMDLAEELVQVAAVAVAWLESL
jgi:hypothetical protein